MTGTVVLSGFQFTEGPVWLSADQARRHVMGRNAGLLFSDIDGDVQYFFDDTGVRIVREPSGNANGNAVGPSGAILTCQHRQRRIVVYDGNRRPETLVDRHHGRRLNSPNDLCVSRDGTVFFTDPPYGVAEHDRELGFQGLFALDRGGSLHLVDRRLVKPNGLAIGSDGSLWVADTETGAIWRYELTGDARVRTRHLALTTSRPDGLAFDSAHRLLVATASGILVHDTNTSFTTTLHFPERPANLCFGGRSGHDLFVCARSSVHRVPWPVPGLGFPAGDPAGPSTS